jgi:hypothetical protein
MYRHGRFTQEAAVERRITRLIAFSEASRTSTARKRPIPIPLALGMLLLQSRGVRGE